jgi:hypothetical protein
MATAKWLRSSRFFLPASAWRLAGGWALPGRPGVAGGCRQLLDDWADFDGHAAVSGTGFRRRQLKGGTSEGHLIPIGV